MNFLVYAAAVIGFLVLLFTLFGANGAPQEAAGAAMGLLLIFIPYSVARVSQAGEALNKQDKIIQLLTKLAPPPSKKEE